MLHKIEISIHDILAIAAVPYSRCKAQILHIFICNNTAQYAGNCASIVHIELFVHCVWLCALYKNAVGELILESISYGNAQLQLHLLVSLSHRPRQPLIVLYYSPIFVLACLIVHVQRVAWQLPPPPIYYLHTIYFVFVFVHSLSYHIDGHRYHLISILYPQQLQCNLNRQSLFPFLPFACLTFIVKFHSVLYHCP